MDFRKDMVYVFYHVYCTLGTLCKTTIRQRIYQVDPEKSYSGPYYRNISKWTEPINISPRV